MTSVNHVAAWVAAIAHFIVGAGWYSALSKAWLAGIGKTEAQVMAEQPNAMMPMLIAFFVAIVIAYTLAWLLPRLSARTAATGAKTGAGLALALIASTLAMNYGFEGRSLSLWLINAGYMVVGMAVMGAIIGGWKGKD